MNSGESNLFARVPGAAGSAPLSLAPGFSRVSAGWRRENRFNGFTHGAGKTAEAGAVRAAAHTRLKPGICLAPTGRHHTSPGHRPGCWRWRNVTALKGRPILPRRTAHEPPLQGCAPFDHPTQGGASLCPGLVWVRPVGAKQIRSRVLRRELCRRPRNVRHRRTRCCYSSAVNGPPFRLFRSFP